MTQGYSGRKSFGRTLVGCVLALFLGLLSPFLLMVETMSLMPVVLIPVLLSAAMAVWFGNAAVFALNGAFLGTMYLGVWISRISDGHGGSLAAHRLHFAGHETPGTFF